MSVKKFKFVSPGVFLREIDKSQIPKEPGGIGPVIIGRAARGPAMKPVKVESYQEFTEIFGDAVSGQSSGRMDTWRKGNGHQATTYGPYAAQAYLKAKINSPVTFIRLLGVTGDDAADAAGATPGWEATSAFGIWGVPVANDGAGDNHTDVYNDPMQATLLGIIYATDATIKVGVDGKEPGHVATAGTANLFDVASGIQPVLVENDHATLLLNKGGTTKPIEFSLKSGDPKFIRNVLNTDPTLTNSELVSSLDDISNLGGYYWLGETFEENFMRLKADNNGANQGVAIFVTKLNDLMKDRSATTYELSQATSPWVIHQLTDSGAFDPADFTKLFRIHTIQEGEEANAFFAEIQRIRIAAPSAISPFGTFDIAVKKIVNDSVRTVDVYENLNLNPNSANYVAKRIGDQHFTWDSSQKRNRVHGNYENQSPYIRIEMGPDLEGRAPSNPRWVPFGFLGAPVPKDSAVTQTGNLLHGDAGTSWGIRDDASTAIGVRVPTDYGITFKWPQQQLVRAASDESNVHSEQKKYVLGMSLWAAARENGLAQETQNFSSIAKEYKDFAKKLANYTNFVTDQKNGTTSAQTQRSQTFTLDEVVINIADGDEIPGEDIDPGQVNLVKHLSGSHDAANGANTATTAYTNLSTTGGARELLTIVDTFRIPFHGGCDGVDITERDPFNMRVVDAATTTANSYAYASIDRAIELMRDAEMLECNLAAMPGISNENLTSKLIQTCEARGDALAIIDLPDVYKPVHQKYYADASQRKNLTVKAAARALENRRINSSYGCTYYPWVQIADVESGAQPWVPPSVVALGVMAYTEQRDQVWFAPAGFNRGGLNEGNAGIPVLQASERLLSSQRDTLYEANINPIASFVSEGLVIFGQKTLQTTRSALDRINVRRLLIFVKKQVSRISNGLLFDNNLPATWNRFKGQVIPFLEEVQTKLGLQDFKVVLDGTTTTPDLVDRNIMYAKIFLKPARAIEFIAVDFVITRSGAEFDD